MSYIGSKHPRRTSIGLVLTYLRGLMFVLVVYTFYGTTALRPLNLKEVLVMPLFETARSDLRFDLFKWFAIIHLQYKNRISNGSVICMTSSFGTKNSFRSFKLDSLNPFKL